MDTALYMEASNILARRVAYHMNVCHVRELGLG